MGISHPFPAQVQQDTRDKQQDELMRMEFLRMSREIASRASGDDIKKLKSIFQTKVDGLMDDCSELVRDGAAKESEIPNFKGSDLGRCPLVSADFWTSDHLSERSRSVDAFSGARARGTPTLKRR